MTFPIKLDKLGRELGRLGAEIAKKDTRQLGRHIQRHFLRELRGETPVFTGEMARRWREAPGQQTSTRLIMRIGNDDEAASIIDRGRRRSKRTKKILGSRKAPRGLVRPVRKRFGRGGEFARMADNSVGRRFR